MLILTVALYISFLFFFLVVSLGIYISYTVYRDGKSYSERNIVYLGNGLLRLIYITLKGITMIDNVEIIYHKAKNSHKKLACGKDFGTETFMLTDLDTIKSVLVQDFDHFVNRRKFGNKTGTDAMFGRMLISLEGEEWKALRSKMSPTFTTGKIKRMFDIMDSSGKKLTKYLKSRIENTGSNVVDLQQGFSKFTMDFIASAAFGIESKAFEQSDPSMFEEMGSKLQFKFTLLTILKFVMAMTTPKLADALGMSIFPRDVQAFFSSVIKNTIKHRQETAEKRNDFIQLLLEARDGQLETTPSSELIMDDDNYEKDAELKSEIKVKAPLEDDDIVSQCVLFILGGFDTTQSVLMLAGYNLAIYTELQEKVYVELRDAFEQNDGELSYEMINSLEYLEKFIRETLRYYPPGIVAERTCTKDYILPGPDKITIPKGSIVQVPIYSIHRDEDYYENPDKFDPERFNPENRSKIHPYAYMPFGLGPRNCIAMRLALVEVKVAIAHLVLNFIMEPSEKTPIPIKFANVGTLKPEGGLQLKFTSRN